MFLQFTSQYIAKHPLNALHFCSSHPRFHSCPKLNMVLIKGIGPLKMNLEVVYSSSCYSNPKRCSVEHKRRSLAECSCCFFSKQWWWVSTLKKHHKTARCLVHYNRSLLDWKFCHDLLNLKTVPNLHGFLSCAEHKRRYSEECWGPNSCWFPRASIVWRKNTMEVSEDQKLFGPQHSSFVFSFYLFSVI